MHFRRFMIGDRVSYFGERFAKDLQGKLGHVISHVHNSDNGVVVEFGDKDAYILDETRHLARFLGFTKGEKHDRAGTGMDTEKSKGPEVQRRKPRIVDQSEGE